MDPAKTHARASTGAQKLRGENSVAKISHNRARIASSI